MRVEMPAPKWSLIVAAKSKLDQPPAVPQQSAVPLPLPPVVQSEKFLSKSAAGQKNESVSMDGNKEDMVMDAEETFPILDDVELPPAKGRAARPRKSDVDPVQKQKKVSLERSARFDKGSDSLRRLFSTPSLMKGEDSNVYAELYTQVEEVVQPQDVFDQMMLTDVTNHFWEQQRYRRCTGTVINSKRRAALEKILNETIGLNDVDAKNVADTYFGVARLEEREVTDYSTQVRIPKTRADIVDLMKQHGFVEADIDRIATETSVDTLADVENLALKHEIRRKATVRELERRRKKRNKQLMKPARG